MNVNYKLWELWKEIVIIYFKILPQYLFGGTDKHHRKLQSLMGMYQAKNLILDLPGTNGSHIVARVGFLKTVHKNWFTISALPI